METSQSLINQGYIPIYIEEQADDCALSNGRNPL